MMGSLIRKTILGSSLSLPLLLGGCSVNMVKANVDIWCDTNHPTTPTREQYALYSHEQKVDMADHNEFGQRFCHWKP